MAGLGEPAAQGGAREVEDPGGVLEIAALAEQRERRAQVQVHPRAPAVLAGKLGAAHPGADALLDNRLLELGEAGEQLQEQAPGGAGGVDAGIAQRREADPGRGQGVQDGQDVLEAAPEPVERTSSPCLPSGS